MKLGNLCGQLLIATPDKNAGAFANALIYICEHNHRGSMGLVINKPSNIRLKAMLKQLVGQIKSDEAVLLSEIDSKLNVLQGGPVENGRGFVLHRPIGDWETTIRVNEHIALTSSSDILLALGCVDGPQDYKVALGYCSWNAGQLETEIVANDWIVIPTDYDVLFSTPANKLRQMALSNISVYRYAQLATTAGHA